jgi:hypothetical protein
MAYAITSIISVFTFLRSLRKSAAKTFILPLALLLTVGSAGAAVTTQAWTPGWDNLSEPLDFSTSHVIWGFSPTGALRITFQLRHARANKLYQVGVAVMDCSTELPDFGQFPFGATTCATTIKQGVTDTVDAVELGVILTDIHGNGSVAVSDPKIAPGTYDLEFFARDGAGCGVTGGGSGLVCNVDFQSPGPFGSETTITIP